MSKKVLITRFPEAAAVTYGRDIQKMIIELAHETLKLFEKHIEPALNEQRQDTTEYLVDGIFDNIKRMFKAIKKKATKSFSERRKLAAAKKFVNSINLFNKHNIEKQLSVKGIDPVQREPWLEAFMLNSIRDNVSYIKNIEENYLSEVEKVVYEGVKEGRSIKQIRESILERVDVAEGRAQFLAVDQTGSILGQMTAQRHQNIGIDKFIWYDASDERVRKSHKELSGQVFSYDDPPTINGRKLLPGEDYRCRCVAIPIFDDEED